MISRMCKNVDQQTRVQVEQLAQKTRSLEILYDAPLRECIARCE